jgi:hypothetical protein
MNTTSPTELPVRTQGTIFGFGCLVVVLYLAAVVPVFYGKDSLVVAVVRGSGYDWTTANNCDLIVFVVAAGAATVGAIVYVVGRRTFLRQYDVRSVRRAFRPYVWITLGHLVIAVVAGVMLLIGTVCRDLSG